MAIQLKTRKVLILGAHFFTLFVAAFVFCGATTAHAATLARPLNQLGLIGWWTFDGGDMIPNVRDRSGNGYHGLLESFTATTSIVGKIGQALTFDGSDDVVRISNSSTNALDLTSGPFTFTAWVNCSGQGSIIAKRSSDTDIQYQMQITDVSGTKYLEFVGNGTGPAPYGEAGKGSTPIVCGQWYHVAGVVDGSGNPELYVNGNLETWTDIDGSRPFTFNHVNVDVSLGARYHTGPATYYNFNGALDDVRMYNRALTANEIRGIYNATSVKVGASKSPGTLSTGLVGHWTFDGKDMTSRIEDKSGNGHYALIKNQSSTTTIPGKVGQGLYLDGVDDYVEISSPMSEIFDVPQLTFSIWVKPNNLNSGTYYFFRQHVATTDRFGLMNNGSGASFYFGNGADTVVGVDLVQGEWQLLTVVYDGTQATDAGKIKIYSNGVQQVFSCIMNCPVTSTSPDLTGEGNFILGNSQYLSPGEFVDGGFDDFRIYTRALSLSEVKQLYNLGGQKLNTPQNTSKGTLSNGLVGLWSFDGKDLTDKVYDRSGNGNNGYIYNAATTTMLAPGALGQALYFDGVSHRYVEIPDNGVLNRTGDYSVSVWVTADKDLPAWAMIFAKTTAGAFSSNSFTIQHGSNSGLIRVYVQDTPGNVTGITTASLADGKFHHIVATMSGSTGNVYLDGVLNTTFTDSAISSGTGQAYIGVDRFLVNDWKGKIDDVRTYNRTLTAEEVRQLYNMGR